MPEPLGRSDPAPPPVSNGGESPLGTSIRRRARGGWARDGARAGAPAPDDPCPDDPSAGGTPAPYVGATALRAVRTGSTAVPSLPHRSVWRVALALRASRLAAVARGTTRPPSRYVGCTPLPTT